VTVALINETPFPAFGFDTELYDSREYYCLAAKATFDFSARGLTVRDEQPALNMTDRYFGEPGESSLSAVTDLIPRRERTDVLITGHASPPNGRPAKRWLAEIKVGDLYKSIQLTGPRAWRHRSVGGWELSPLNEVDAVPLRYELAFGGERPTRDDEDRDVWLPNPVGRGYVGRHPWAKDRIWDAPQMLSPVDDLGSMPGGNHKTCGFGPIPGDWSPRVERIGTTDEHWRRHVAPHLPSDFDLRFFNCAPDDQQAKGFLRGNEEVALLGLLSELAVFRLPDWQATALMVDHDDLVLSLDMDLSTVHIDLDERTASLIWRLSTPADRWHQASISLMPR